MWPHDNAADPRILIIKPSSLGDIVHALPVLAACRAQYPDSHIAWLVNTSFAELLYGHPVLDEVIEFDRRHYGRMLRSRTAFEDFAGFVDALRDRRFDLVLDLQGLVRSGFLAWATRAEQRFGFDDAREMAWIFYNRRVRVPRTIRHAVDRNIHLSRSAGLEIDTPAFPLAIRDDERDEVRRLLGRDEPPIAVIPGARWRTKLWPAERWAELIDRLAEDDPGPFVLLGGPADVERNRDVASRCHTATIDLTGKSSLRTLAALIDECRFVICHDSGPMHLAAALDKPIVAIFGPTDPTRCGPYASRTRVVRTELECSNCYLRTCSHHSCMQQLEVDTVLQAVRSMLEGRNELSIAGRVTSASQPK
jgi:lipopolysaccharide heptosyltransferase I